MISSTTCTSTRAGSIFPSAQALTLKPWSALMASGVFEPRGGAELTAPVVVMATGIVSNPYTASIPGRARFAGRVLHSVEYRRPDGHAGRRVLVIGAGNSAGEIAAELAAAGAHVAVAVRSGARVVPRDLFGVPIQYLAVAISRFPRHVQQSIAAAMARAAGSRAARRSSLRRRRRDAPTCR